MMILDEIDNSDLAVALEKHAALLARREMLACELSNLNSQILNQEEPAVRRALCDAQRKALGACAGEYLALNLAVRRAQAALALAEQREADFRARLLLTDETVPGQRLARKTRIDSVS
jgi:hypothetical protein